MSGIHDCEKKLSVFCSNFVLLISILNSWWSVNWLHILYNKCTRRNRSELINCPVMKDQWDCVLNDLEELGGKEFLLTSQHNIEKFSCFLRLLSLYSSTFHQINVEIAQDDHDEKEHSVVWHWVTDWRIIFWLNTSPLSFTNGWSSCGWTGKNTSLFFFFFDRLAKAGALVFNAKFSDWISAVSCSLLSFPLLLLESVTNLFKPWEILTNEWELCLLKQF